MSSTRAKQNSLLGPYAMNGGDGQYSYTQNSSYQGGAVDAAKSIMEEEIAVNLDINQLISSAQTKGAFLIADFGCSTGQNSFTAMQIITRAIEKKIANTQGPGPGPEFYVFFNDQVVNDFNTLFQSLPPQRKFHAAGIPGSFHDRLFPKAFLDLAYSSFGLNWLSQVPEAVADPASPAWNKGRVHYAGAKQEVLEAYSNHYARDVHAFLEARAEELVSGGLMALLVPGVPAFQFNDSATSFTVPDEMDVLGSCLVDMANKGIVSEEKVDTFNFPLYFAIPEELKAIIERNGSFGIQRMEIVDSPGKQGLCSAEARATFLRAVFEGMLINQFGRQVMDELFDRYTDKLAASPHFLDAHNDKSNVIFLLLKRKPDE